MEVESVQNLVDSFRNHQDSHNIIVSSILLRLLLGMANRHTRWSRPTGLISYGTVWYSSV